MITVSIRSRGLGELNQAVKELWNAYSKLRHRSIWNGVRGAIIALEITWNERDRTWHPHLHILVDSEFIVWKRLREAWGEVTLGEGSSVYIQKCRAGWQRELIKYVTKVADLLKDREALREFLKFAQNRRFIRTYGTLYNCATEEQIEGGKIICSGCGAEMVLEQEHVRIEDIYGKELGLAYVRRICRGSPKTDGVAAGAYLVDA